MERVGLFKSLRDQAQAKQNGDRIASEEEAAVLEAERHKSAADYVAEHQAALIDQLVKQAEEAAKEGKLEAQIQRTEPTERARGLRDTMIGIKAYFEDEGFDAKLLSSDNGIVRYVGSDGDEYIPPTHHTYGVQIGWDK